MRVRYSKQARADLLEIAEYVAADNPSAATLVRSTYSGQLTCSRANRPSA